MRAERSFEGVAVSPLASLLMRGRDRIARGWCQGKLWEGESVCAVGALYDKAGDVVSLVGPTALKARDLLNETVGGSVVHYNDVPYHTQADILAVYDKAINKALAEPTY